MNHAANHPALQERESPARWLACLLIVVLAHGAGGLLLVSRTVVPRGEITTPTVMIDLEPLPKPEPVAEPAPAPPEPVAERPLPLEVPLPEPPPELVLEPPPPIPVELPPPEPPPEVALEPPPVPVTPEVPLPPRPPPPVRRPPPRQAAQQPTPTDPAPPVSAPTPAAPAPAAVASWESRLLAHLKRGMRYPPGSQMRREQGVTLLWFRMTPSGEVLAFRLERSSGHELLDQETLDLIRRAQPLPALPGDMPQQVIERVVPLRYELRQR